MGEELAKNPQSGTFGTSISFDIEETAAPVRRRQKQQRETHETIEEQEETMAGCPGCGAEIDHDEWLDCLVGFVSGANQFEIGNPVRARIVQNLRNQISKMNVPNPRDSWELAIVGKLMTEIERIVLAEINRHNQKQTISSGMSEIEKQELITETEIRVVNSMAAEIQEALVAELTPRLEQEIRIQVEQELWQQFEQEWKNRTVNNS